MSTVTKRQVEAMNVRVAIRTATSQLFGRTILLGSMLVALGLCVPQVVSAAGRGELGLVRYQPEPESPTNPTTPANPTLNRTTTESAKPQMETKGGTIYSEGEFFHEGGDGFYPFEHSGMSADCGYGCPPSWTFTADAFYLNRATDNQNSFSSGFRMPEFDYDTAGRYSLAHRFDCLIGWELTYFGPFEWEQANAVAGAGLNALLPLAGAFTNAVAQEELYISRIQSYEFNQKWWGWDVITTSAGVRFIDVEEDLFFNSANALGDTGAITVLTNNHLMGGQVGLDLILPVGRFSTTTRLRGGIYANFQDYSLFVGNTGVVQFDVASDTVDFGSMIELGYYISYYITPRIAVRAGYESMWLYGLALAPDQLVNTLNFVGDSLDSNGDIIYHGASAGVEVNW